MKDAFTAEITGGRHPSIFQPRSEFVPRREVYEGSPSTLALGSAPLSEQMAAFGDSWLDSNIFGTVYNNLRGKGFMSRMETTRDALRSVAQPDPDYLVYEDPNLLSLPSNYWDFILQHSRSATDTEHYARIVRKDIFERQNRAKSGLATMAGSILGTLKNPGAALSMIARTAGAVRAGVGLTGLEEIALMEMQPDRRIEDAALAVGLTAVLGGVSLKLMGQRRGATTENVVESADALSDAEKTAKVKPVDVPDDSYNGLVAARAKAMDSGDIDEFQRLDDMIDELPFGPWNRQVDEGDGGPYAPPPPKDAPNDPDTFRPVSDRRKDFDPEGEAAAEDNWLTRLRMSPLNRIATSGSNAARRVLYELAESPYLQIKNMSGVASFLPADRLRTIRWMAPMFQSVAESEAAYARYVTRMGNNALGEPLEYQAFMREAGRAKARIDDTGYVHDVPEVMEVAHIWNNKVYKPLGEKAKSMGMLTSDLRRARFDAYKRLKEANRAIKEEGADPSGVLKIKEEITKLTARIKEIEANPLSNSYLNRIYNKDLIRANPEKFLNILRTAGRGRSEEEAVETMKAILKQNAHNADEDAVGLAGDLMRNREDIVGPARSLRERTLADIPDEALEEFLERDIAALGKYYAHRMGSDVEIHEKFGSIDLYDQINRIRKEWGARIEEAKGKPTEIARLERLRDQEIDDIKVVRDRVRGTYGMADDPDSWTHRSIRLAKMYNATTLLTGALAALPDLGNIIIKNGLSKTFGDLYQGMIVNNAGIKLALEDAQLAGEAWDMYSAMRAMQMADLDQAMAATSQFERNAASFTQTFFNISLINPWNVSVKAMTSLVAGTRIIDESIKWAAPLRNSAKAKIDFGPNAKGKPVSYNRNQNTVYIDNDLLRQQYANKIWKSPKAPGVNALPDDAFKTYDDFKQFVIEHELAHADHLPIKGIESRNPRHGAKYAAYENRMNEIAFKRMGVRQEPSTKFENTLLAKGGIDADMAERIAVQFETHGFVDGRVRLANAGKWTDEGAKEAYLAALGKEINMTIVTPGNTELPNIFGGGLERLNAATRQRAADRRAKMAEGERLSIPETAEHVFMSPQMAQMMFQFKAFGVAATSRVLVPGMQMKDASFILGMAHTAAIGMLVEKARQDEMGYEAAKWEDTFVGGVKRSLPIGWLGDVDTALDTISDGRFGIGAMVGASQTERSGMDKLGALGGPVVGQIDNFANIISGLSDGHIDPMDANAIRKSWLLNQTFWMDNAFDFAEDAITTRP
tara:strand:+ start:6234 stop:10022 length:3789 start_codon:yes stop_codon:yes gene_type:complete